MAGRLSHIVAVTLVGGTCWWQGILIEGMKGFGRRDVLVARGFEGMKGFGSRDVFVGRGPY